MNLYVALLYYLQISLDASKSLGMKVNIIRNYLTPVTIVTFSNAAESKKNGNDDMMVLYSYGEVIMDVICRDACDAPDIGMVIYT